LKSKPGKRRNGPSKPNFWLNRRRNGPSKPNSWLNRRRNEPNRSDKLDRRRFPVS
jgi:hypothetical protein